MFIIKNYLSYTSAWPSNSLKQVASWMPLSSPDRSSARQTTKCPARSSPNVPPKACRWFLKNYGKRLHPNRPSRGQVRRILTGKVLYRCHKNNQSRTNTPTHRHPAARRPRLLDKDQQEGVDCLGNGIEHYCCFQEQRIQVVPSRCRYQHDVVRITS